MSEKNGTTETGEAIPSILKARDAVRLRHSQHQQTLLERQAEHNETLRESHNRRHFLGEIEGEAQEMPGDINVDSPTTTHNHYAEPKKKAGGLAKLVLGAGLLATGAGAGIGGSLVLDVLRDRLATPAPAEVIEPTVKPAEKTPDSERKYSLDLGDPIK